MATQLALWLINQCHAFDVQDVRVQIGSEKWEGCRYKQTFEYQIGMDAVSRGEKKAGDKYTEEGFYLLGSLPKDYNKFRRRGPDGMDEHYLCFPFEDTDWYVAGYMLKENMKLENAPSHPFGISFMVRPWRVPDGKRIDSYARKPYTRIPLIVTTL